MLDNGECVVKYSPWLAEVEGFGCGQSISTSEWVKASDSVVVKDGLSIRSLQPLTLPHNPTIRTKYVPHSPTPHPRSLKTMASPNPNLRCQVIRIYKGGVLSKLISSGASNNNL